MPVNKCNGKRVYKANSYCKSCKGECCKHMACHYAPSDFGTPADITFYKLKEEIEKGCISIDWWEGPNGKEEYYLRARHVNAPIVDPSWGGRCVHLTDTGCGLSWEKRPMGGKTLRPRRSYDDNCEQTYSKYQCKQEWSLYADVLADLAQWFRAHPYTKTIHDICEDETGKHIEFVREYIPVVKNIKSYELFGQVDYRSIDISREMEWLGLSKKSRFEEIVDGINKIIEGEVNKYE